MAITLPLWRNMKKSSRYALIRKFYSLLGECITSKESFDRNACILDQMCDEEYRLDVRIISLCRLGKLPSEIVRSVHEKESSKSIMLEITECAFKDLAPFFRDS